MSTPAPVLCPAAGPSGIAAKRTRDNCEPFIHSAFDDFGLSPAETRVYARIVRRANGGEVLSRNDAGGFSVVNPANGDRFCRESLPNMARRLAMSQHTVRAALKVLENFGMVRKHRHPGHVSKFFLTSRKEWIVNAERGRKMLHLVPKSALEDERPTLFIPAKLDDLGLSLIEFALFLRICRLAGKGNFWVRLPAVAKRLGVSVRAAQEALNVLVTLNMVVRARDGRGHYLSVNLSCEWRDRSVLEALREQSRKSKRPESKTRAEEGVKRAQRNTKVAPLKVAPDPMFLFSDLRKASDQNKNIGISSPSLRIVAKSAPNAANGGDRDFKNFNAFGELNTLADLYPTMSASPGG